MALFIRGLRNDVFLKKLRSMSSLYKSRNLSEGVSTSKSIGVVGAPISKGQTKSGVDNGPDVLREFGILRNLQRLGWDVTDYGNVVFNSLENDVPVGNVLRAKSVGQATSAIADTVERALLENHFCLTLGGDHSLAIGTISGAARVHHDLCVLWVDAHADLNTPKTTESGNLHGMPLSFLLHEMKEKGLSPKDLPNFEWVHTCLDAKSLAYIGLRDVDPFEKLFLENLGIKTISIDDIEKFGIESCFEDAINAINPFKSRPMHVSFDIDALDPNYAPSTGTPVKDGLTIRESLYIAEQVALSGCLRSLDMVEVNINLGQSCDAEKTLLVAASVVQNHLQSLQMGSLRIIDPTNITRLASENLKIISP